MEHNLFNFSSLTKWLENHDINIRINITSEPKAAGARVPNPYKLNRVYKKNCSILCSKLNCSKAKNGTIIKITVSK